MSRGLQIAAATKFIGLLSAASGAAMLGWPGPLARLYGLPRSPMLVRWLGARDLAVGALLVGRKTNRGGAVGRALSDVLDAALIWRHAGHHGKSALARVAVALGSALLNATLAGRLR